MVDLDILKRHGVSVEAWKPKFENPKPTEDFQKFKYNIWRRANDGITSNLTNWKIFRAIDAAWDTPLRQITPTLLTNYSGQSIANTDPKMENVLKVFRSLDLTQYISEEVDLKTNKPTGRKTLDLPTFFQIIIPLVKPYVVIRWAKLCNDRNVDPRFKYDPIRNSPKERLRCGVLTSRINLIANQYNYADVQKQSILGMLLYPECYQFIETEWNSEKQLVMENGKEKEIYVREGLTYHRPHPTRVYRDEAHPGYTLLSDTGCRWIGYWRIKRYGELEDDPTLWNKGRVAIGSNWTNDYSAYFTSFASCAMQFPNVNQSNQNDVQTKLGNNFYVSDQRDMGVMVTEHFEKIVPSQVGLGDYDYPIWARFAMAGDGTVIYAAPLPGTPVIYYADTVDSNRVNNSSLALDIVPFEDTLTNLLTQLILSAKQNLAGITWLDTDAVDEKDVKALENTGEVYYRMRKFMRYSSRKLTRQQINPKDQIFTTNFPWVDINGIISAFNIVLNLLERVIQISPQEVGSSASHEQSKAEVDYINRSTSNRVSFVSSAIDRATDAWKKQLYEYLMAYGEEEIYAQLAVEELRNIDEATLNDMGFTVEEHAAQGDKFAKVHGKKTALQIEYIALTNEAGNKTDNKTVANAMTQVFIGAMNNPLIANALGPEQSIQLLNQIIKWLGLPEDFRLRVAANSQNPQAMQALQEDVSNAILNANKKVMEEVNKAMELIAMKMKEIDQRTRENSDAISKITELINRALSTQPQPPMPTPATAYDSAANIPPGTIPNAPNPNMVIPAGMPAI